MASNQKKVIVITGPTCVGKTSYAINTALEYKAEIFSADSRQIYKEMSIGTAAPSEEELSQVQHHFIATKSIHESYSAGDYEKEILTSLHHYFKENDVAVVCGGTGLYIDALVHGLDEFPDISETVRHGVLEDLESKGLDFLLEELLVKDDDYYEKVDRSNHRRVTRAIEVIRQSNQPFSSFFNQQKAPRFFDTEWIILERDRQKLYSRINQRVEIMVDNGLIVEAQNLYPYKNLKALQTVGYQELFSHFNEEITLERAVELIKQNSRRYAKRQITWLRKKVGKRVLLS